MSNSEYFLVNYPLAINVEQLQDGETIPDQFRELLICSTLHIQSKQLKLRAAKRTQSL